MNNSEILFLYDAKMTNPNGNVDDENRPRMDYESKRNLVSDVRLKRYVRDYLELMGKELYVGKVDGKTVNAEKRLDALFNAHNKKIEKKTWNEDEEAWMLDQFIDVRMFGATMAVKGHALAYTGPVQFSWGYSLNPVKLMENTITTHFSSTGTQDQGTMGKDYRVEYSFLSFYGIVSGKRAQVTRFTEEDLSLLDQAMVKSIPLLASRSKIGQAPRLYMRIEYKSDLTLHGDWRDQLEPLPENLKQIQQVDLQVSRLVDKLSRVKSDIHRIVLWEDPDLVVSSHDKKGKFSDGLIEDLQSLISPLHV